MIIYKRVEVEWGNGGRNTYVDVVHFEAMPDRIVIRGDDGISRIQGGTVKNVKVTSLG